MWDTRKWIWLVAMGIDRSPLFSLVFLNKGKEYGNVLCLDALIVHLLSCVRENFDLQESDENLRCREEITPDPMQRCVYLVKCEYMHKKMPTLP